MSRYIERGNSSEIVVSQEILDVLILGGIGYGIWKLIKNKQAEAERARKRIAQLETEASRRFEPAVERYGRLIKQAEKATVIKETVKVPAGFFGRSSDGSAVIKHAHDLVLQPVEQFLNRSESVVDSLIKVATKDPNNKELIEPELNKLIKLVESSAKAISVNGFNISIRGEGSERSIESSYSASRDDDVVVACPTPEEYKRLLIIAGGLLSVLARTADDVIPRGSYVAHDLQYINELNEMIDGTLHALTGYLLRSIGEN